MSGEQPDWHLQLEPLLPSEQGGMGRPRLDNRPIVEAILWKHRTGAPWRDLPESFGPWNTVFTRFNRWNRSGVWQRVLEALRGEADCEWVMVDGTVIRAHQHAAGAKGGPTFQGLGRSRGGFSTKVHLIGDAHGNPVDFVLTPGQSHESKQLGSLLMGREAGAVLGDRAYDGKSCRDQIASIGAEAVVPPHPCRKDPAAFDKHFYKARHAVENLFAKLKQYRSLATRYDKTMRNYSAMVAIACVLTWLRL
ncbi:IS5 family transposase [Geothrix sp. PMB-07]|uniref:IS5 family transposase n=1 Tax=Geothrix sp. PMB-07 TaxID=3068640 RepID=UPI0035581240